MIKTGLDRIVDDPRLIEGLGRIGLVTNQAVTTSDCVAAVDAVFSATKRCQKSTLSAVFGAQHGYYQTEQDNMIETPDLEIEMDDGSKLPLYSLYSKTRVPTAEQLKGVDTLVVDLRDIGCRVYTYMLTLAGCLRAGADAKKRVVVLDRPNPIGLSDFDVTKKTWHRVEGNLIDLQWQSFVGWYSIPMRHGLTLGELGKVFISEDKLNVEYSVIEAKGLKRSTSLETLSKEPFVLPSPNIPFWDSAFFFPAFVTLEGTNVSEGRGSTLPFQIVGAPYLNSSACKRYLEDNAQGSDHSGFGGVGFRIHDFRPTFNKHSGKICHGLQFHCLQPELPNLFALGIHFLRFCAAAHGSDFKWREPGYEYNYTDNPILLILGHSKWLDFFERTRGVDLSDRQNKKELAELFEWSHNDAQTFAEKTRFAHLYS